MAVYLKIRGCPFPSTTRCHLELLMHRCNNTCSRQKCLISSKIFHWWKAEFSIYISNWILWEIGRVDLPECCWISPGWQPVSSCKAWSSSRIFRSIPSSVHSHTCTTLAGFSPGSSLDSHQATSSLARTVGGFLVTASALHEDTGY